MQITHLEKITIIIFSYNRQKYLRRAIKYWSNYNVKLVILDGSNSKLDDKYIDSKNLKYVHDPRSLYDRLLVSINYIETEFMILGCDDEFYLPSALSSCIGFLIKDSNYSSCGGRALAFSQTDNNFFLGKQCYPKLKDLKVDCDNSIERIKKHFSNYVPSHLYSVNRSSNWKIICKYVFVKEYNFFAAWELQIEFLVLAAGKSKIIPELLWMRNRGEPSIRTKNNQKVKNYIHNWWYDNNKNNEKLDFLNCMRDACKELSTEANIFNQNIISNLFETYINNRSFIKRSLLKYNVLGLLEMKFFSLKEKLNKNLLLKKNKNDKDFFEEAKKLESESVLVNYEDINYMFSIIQNEKKN